MIVGAPAGFGMAKIYVGRGSKWKEQAELTVKPIDGNENRAIPSFGVAVDLTGPHELATPDYALIGASRAGADESLAGAAFIFARNRNQWTFYCMSVKKKLSCGISVLVTIERVIAK